MKFDMVSAVSHPCVLRPLSFVRPLLSRVASGRTPGGRI